ncbi:hypothetical protein [Undibacterium curvum]|uniref:hypothetical protein n=1 Tax=Undibacterium curvum TaxID=2762294 RepID=UPI003D0D8DF7
MLLISFVNDGAEICKILGHICIESISPKISQALSSILWDAFEEVEPKEYFDTVPDYDVGQHLPGEDVDECELVS